MIEQQPQNNLPQQNLAQKNKPNKNSNQMIPQMGKINSLSTRITLIEETINRLDERMSLIEQRILKLGKETKIEIKTNSEEIKDINIETEKMKDDLNLIIDDLKGSARKEDIEILKKYIQMWEPMQFLTRKEFKEKIKEIEDKIDRV